MVHSLNAKFSSVKKGSFVPNIEDNLSTLGGKLMINLSAKSQTMVSLIPVDGHLCLGAA